MMKKIFLGLFWKFLRKDDILWIVNDLGELGIKIFDNCIFMYKGELFQYTENPHPEKPFKYRTVNKREFGESGPKSIQILGKGIFRTNPETDELETWIDINLPKE